MDRGFLASLAVLVVFGLFMLLSASGPIGYQRFHDAAYFFKHQLINGLLPGAVLFFIFSRLDYRRLMKLAPLALGASILLLLMVYMPGIGMRFGGSGRWVYLGIISFQPSEFVKICVLIYTAAWLEKRGAESKTLDKGFLPFLLPISLIMILLILQPNTGSMFVIVASALTTYYISGAPFVWFAGLGVLGTGLFALLLKLSPYRAARFMTFLHPELDPDGIGYQINQAFLAIGSGGLLGLGYGHSRQKYLYLPEAYGDSIFAVMAEELGFIVCLMFLALVGYLVWRCWKIAKNADDPFGRYLAVGIGAWIAIQTILNIASMLGLMPMTGVTLPFVSYGSSAFVALSIACGIMASISRGTKIWREQ